MIRSAKYTQILVQQLDAWQQHENNARPFYRFSDSKHFNQTNSSKNEKNLQTCIENQFHNALMVQNKNLLLVRVQLRMCS